jgi:hypothetical protein
MNTVDHPPAVMAPDELRAKAARLNTQIAAMPPGPDAKTLRNVAEHYIELAQRLDVSLLVLDAPAKPEIAT